MGGRSNYRKFLKGIFYGINRNAEEVPMVNYTGQVLQEVKINEELLDRDKQYVETVSKYLLERYKHYRKGRLMFWLNYGDNYEDRNLVTSEEKRERVRKDLGLSKEDLSEAAKYHVLSKEIKDFQHIQELHQSKTMLPVTSGAIKYIDMDYGKYVFLFIRRSNKSKNSLGMKQALNILVPQIKGVTFAGVEERKEVSNHYYIIEKEKESQIEKEITEIIENHKHLMDNKNMFITVQTVSVDKETGNFQIGNIDKIHILGEIVHWANERKAQCISKENETVK